MSSNLLSAEFGVTMVLTETELSMYAPSKLEQELTSAYSRIANLEDTLEELRVTHTSLATRFLKLQRDHVRVDKENRRLKEEKLSISSTFPETVTEIISLRKQMSDVTEQLKKAEQTGVYWQLRFESQQEAIDKYAHCIDEMQVELRSRSAHQKA